MKNKDVVKNLWKEGFFKTHKAVKQVDKALLKKYGVTAANTSALLRRCDVFLRKNDKGWIQKYEYNESEETQNNEVDYFRLLQIHPEIVKSSKKLFNDGYNAEAIFAAFKRVNNLVKEKSGIRNTDGTSLMQYVFSPKNPILRLNDLVTVSDRDEQTGFMEIFAGSMQGIRNPKGHDDIVQNDKHYTLEHIALASLLCKKLDKTRK